MHVKWCYEVFGEMQWWYKVLGYVVGVKKPMFGW